MTERNSNSEYESPKPDFLELFEQSLAEPAQTTLDGLPRASDEPGNRETQGAPVGAPANLPPAWERLQ